MNFFFFFTLVDVQKGQSMHPWSGIVSTTREFNRNFKKKIFFLHFISCYSCLCSCFCYLHFLFYFFFYFFIFLFFCRSSSSVCLHTHTQYCYHHYCCSFRWLVHGLLVVFSSCLLKLLFFSFIFFLFLYLLFIIFCLYSWA